MISRASSLQKSFGEADWSLLHFPLMKKTIRAEMRERRKALSPASYAEKSRAIRLKLENLPEFMEADKILVYLSTKQEVDTHELVQDCLDNEQVVYAPKIVGDKLVICPVKNWDELKKGTFGILEPCEIIDPEHPNEMDFILVPGVAFDRKGHRLGYGKGFYDKMLKGVEGHIVGLAFQEQMVKEIPKEAHDIPMDIIITDQSIIQP